MITYDSTSALIVVDVQNDFADPRGSLFVRVNAKLPERLDERERKLFEELRAAGV